MNSPDYIKEFREKFGKDTGHHYENCNCGEGDENKCALAFEGFLESKVKEAEAKGWNQAVDYIQTRGNAIGAIASKDGAIIYEINSDILQSARNLKP